MEGGGGLAAVSAGISEVVLWLVAVLLVAGGAWTLWKVLWAAR
ncbi:hypothetical protein BH24ACI5_BH24ACI5_13040 [soil metagenome]